MKKVAIIGYGVVGKAYHKMFPEAVIYDEPKNIGTRDEVNKCDMAIICVPTDSTIKGELNMMIVEHVVQWLQTGLILIKSALMPGTVDRLKAEYGKRITVSIEYIGESNYFMPAWKYPDPKNPTTHNFIVIGGDKKDTSECAEILWEKMSPDIFIHQVSAIEAELGKLIENCWGAMKVSFFNEIFEICKIHNANFIDVLMGWRLDGRTEAMHSRVLSYKRGWKSKCWDKDIPALVSASRKKGYKPQIIEAMLYSNRNLKN